MLSKNEEDRVQELTGNSLFVNAADTTTTVPLPGIQTGPYFDAECVAALKKGGFSVVSLSNFFWFEEDFYNAVRRFADFYATYETLGKNFAVGSSYAQIEEALRNQKVVGLISSQNSMIIDNEIRPTHYEPNTPGKNTSRRWARREESRRLKQVRGIGD
jgi:hypothetical protein